MAETRISEQLTTGGDTFLGIGKNRIINGEMRIDQRKAGTALTVNNLAAFYSVDMWWGAGQSADGVYTLVRASATPPTGFTHYLRATVTTADASLSASQEYHVDTAIEGQNIRDFGFGTSWAKTFTISFWVRSSLTGTYGLLLIAGNGLRGYVTSYTINSANTWERKTITVTADTTGTWDTSNGAGVILRFGLAYGSSLLTGSTNTWLTMPTYFYGPSGMVNWMATNSNTWDLTGVQLELGGSATAYEYRPVETELALCQRYFEKSYDVDTSVGSNAVTQATRLTFAVTNTNQVQSSQIFFKVRKRITPTMTFYRPDSSTSGVWLFRTSGGVDNQRAVSDNATNTFGSSIAQTVTSAELWAQGHWTADASL